MIDPMEFDFDQPEQIVYVVGLGPGDPYYMTQEAQNTLESVDAICGYRVYIDLIKDEFPCEEYYATGMTQEIDRCRWALEKASTGKPAFGTGSGLPGCGSRDRTRPDRSPQRRSYSGCAAGA